MKDLKRVLENIDSLGEFIYNNAPHGSGIDYDYNNIRVEHYSIDNENKVIFENAFHCMNENGFYDGILPFRVVIGQNIVPVIKFIGLNSSEWNRVRKYDVRSYLEDVYYEWANNSEYLLELLIKIL